MGKTADPYQTYALESVAMKTAQRQHTNMPTGSCLLKRLLLQVHSLGNGWELFNLWYTVQRWSTLLKECGQDVV